MSCNICKKKVGEADGSEELVGSLGRKNDRNPLVYSHATFLNKQVRGAVRLVSLSEKKYSPSSYVTLSRLAIFFKKKVQGVVGLVSEQKILN